jgi:hypothetical protein
VPEAKPAAGGREDCFGLQTTGLFWTANYRTVLDCKLQDCFAITDWNMFWDSSADIEEYTTSVPQPEAMDYRQHSY